MFSISLDLSKVMATKLFSLLCLWAWVNIFLLGEGVDPNSLTNFNKQCYSAYSSVVHHVIYTIAAKKF